METKQNTLRSQTVRCPHCGEYYSVTYKYCPFCDAGRKEQERKIKEKRQRRKSMFTGLFAGFEPAPKEEPERRKKSSGAPPRKKEAPPREAAPRREHPRREAEYDNTYNSYDTHEGYHTSDRSAGPDSLAWSDPPGGIDLYPEDGFNPRRKEPARKPKPAEPSRKEPGRKEPSKSGRKKDAAHKESRTREPAAHETPRKDPHKKEAAHKEPPKKETARKPAEVREPKKTEKPVKAEKPKKTSFWNRGGRRPTSELNEEEKAARLADRKARAEQRKRERERAARAAAVAAAPKMGPGPVYETDTVPESFGFPETEETKTDPAAFVQAPVTEEGPVVETDPNAAAIEDIPVFIPPEMEQEAAAVPEGTEPPEPPVEAPPAEPENPDPVPVPSPDLPEEPVVPEEMAADPVPADAGEAAEVPDETWPDEQPAEMEELPLTDEEAADEAERSRWELMRTMEQGDSDVPPVEVASGLPVEEVPMPEGLTEPAPEDLTSEYQPMTPDMETVPEEEPAAAAESQEAAPEDGEDLDALLSEIHTILNKSPVPELSSDELADPEPPVQEVHEPVAPDVPVSQEPLDQPPTDSLLWTKPEERTPEENAESEEEELIDADVPIGTEWAPPMEQDVPIDYGENFYTPMEDINLEMTDEVTTVDELLKELEEEDATQKLPTAEELLQELRADNASAEAVLRQETSEEVPAEDLPAADETDQTVPSAEENPTQKLPSVDEVLKEMHAADEAPTQELPSVDEVLKEMHAIDDAPTQKLPSVDEVLKEMHAADDAPTQKLPSVEEVLKEMHAIDDAPTKKLPTSEELAQAMASERENASEDAELDEALKYVAQLTKDEPAETEAPASDTADTASEPAEEPKAETPPVKESRREARRRKKEERRKQKEAKKQAEAEKQAALAAAKAEEEPKAKEPAPESPAEPQPEPKSEPEPESQSAEESPSDPPAEEPKEEESKPEDAPVKESRREARRRKKEERRKQREAEALAEEEDEEDLEEDEEDLDSAADKKHGSNVTIILVALAIVVVAFFVISHSLAPDLLQNLFHRAPAAEGLVLSEDTVNFTEAGMTSQLSVDFAPEGAKPVEVSWASSDKAVATVDSNGLVTAVAPGVASVSASMADGPSVVCAVKCSWGDAIQPQPPAEAAPEGTPPEGEAPADPSSQTAEQAPAKLTLSSTDITLDGEGKTMKLDLTGASGPVKWTSSKESIATVSADGTVTAVGKGSATVVAEYNGESIRCEVRCIW